MRHAIWFLATLGAYSLYGPMVLGGFVEDTFPASVIEDAQLNSVSSGCRNTGNRVLFVKK